MNGAGKCLAVLPSTEDQNHPSSRAHMLPPPSKPVLSALLSQDSGSDKVVLVLASVTNTDWYGMYFQNPWGQSDSTAGKVCLAHSQPGFVPSPASHKIPRAPPSVAPKHYICICNNCKLGPSQVPPEDAIGSGGLCTSPQEHCKGRSRSRQGLSTVIVPTAALPLSGFCGHGLPFRNKIIIKQEFISC